MEIQPQIITLNTPSKAEIVGLDLNKSFDSKLSAGHILETKIQISPVCEDSKRYTQQTMTIDLEEPNSSRQKAPWAPLDRVRARKCIVRRSRRANLAYRPLHTRLCVNPIAPGLQACVARYCTKQPEIKSWTRENDANQRRSIAQQCINQYHGCLSSPRLMYSTYCVCYNL